MEDENRDRRKEWILKNPEKNRESKRNWNRRNKDKIKIYINNWNIKNPDKKYEHNSNKKYSKKYNSTEASHRHRFGGNRQIALERDNWQCQECGMNNEQHIVIFGKSLVVHHIDGNGRNSNQPNNDISNLLTLCSRCHGTIEGHSYKEVQWKTNNKKHRT